MIKNPRRVPWTVYRGPYGIAKQVERIEGECSQCNRTLVIEDDNGEGWECECGQLYNLGGQELVPRSEWDEPMEEDE